MNFSTTLRGIVAGSLLLGSVAMTASPVTADDDDRFGAYLYAGTPDAVDSATVVEEIGELEQDDDDRDRLWTLLGDGQDMPDELYLEDDELDDDDDVTLDDILAEPHMIVVHEQDSTSSPIVAVGVVEGTVADDGSLLIQLNEHDASGFEGRAWFGPESLTDDDDEDDEDDLDVVVGAYPAGSVEPLGTPGAIG